MSNAALIASLLVSPGTGALAFSNPASPGLAESSTVIIRAHIDGRSRLVLDADTARWEHHDYAAPGRWLCDSGRPADPTVIGAAEWFPDWPDVPTCENRDCGCSSSVFVGVDPPLPDAPFAVFLEEIDCRSSCSIIEFPSLANGYSVVIEFDDNRIPDATWYEVALVIEACEASRYCDSIPNSTGEAAEINATGSLSVSQNDTWLEASRCPPRSFGLFFYGRGRAALPFSDGLLCVSPFSPGLIRLPPVTRVEESGQTQRHLDFEVLPAHARIDGNSTWNFQFWFRDGQAGGTGANLSDAVEVTFCQ